ncbi:MAG: peptidylprolyl isomerase [Flavobacteriales bacterium]
MKRLILPFVGCAIAASLLLSSCADQPKTTDSSTPPKAETPVDHAGTTATPANQDTSASKSQVVTPETTQPAEPAKQPETAAKSDKQVKVKISTPYGDMIAILYNETPKHRDNFLKLVDKKYYDGTLFHRCINGFMIQGGDPNSKGAAADARLGTGGPGYTVPAEFNASLIHKKGALAAARTGGPSNPNRESSGSQFYVVQGAVMTDAGIAQVENMVAGKMAGFKYTDEQKKLYKTIGGTAQLDMDYTVFGEVISGLDVIDKIAKQKTKPGDRPVVDVTMTVTRVK